MARMTTLVRHEARHVARIEVRYDRWNEPAQVWECYAVWMNANSGDLARTSANFLTPTEALETAAQAYLDLVRTGG